MIARSSLAVAALAGSLHAHPAQAVDHFPFGRFGEVTVYPPAGEPRRVALFVSGDGGWNHGVVQMARILRDAGGLVGGVDVRRYLRAVEASPDQCVYLPGDLESLSQYVQERLALPRYHIPALAGFSTGATLVYATLAQAPDNTFRGAISLSLCPSLVLRKEPCPRNGLASQPADRGSERRLEPVTGLPTPWIVLQGDIDEVCPADSAEAFVRQVPGAELVTLPKVGHGFSVTRRWAPQFEAAADRLQEEPPSKPAAQDTLPGLPLVELIPPTVTSDYFAIILSGDGGWASIDKKIGEELAKNGVPVVGFNSLKYFWGKQRTAAEVGGDLGRIIEHFTEAWHKESVIVIGYSRGADVLPVMANNLPPGLIDRVKLLTFVGLEHETNLKFHMGDWLHSQHHAEFQLLPEVQRLKGTKMLCIYGDKEKDTLCPELEPDLAEVVKLEGGHHLDGDYPALTRLILARVP